MTDSPDTELTHYRELAEAIILDIHPILPRPHWNQDTALVAFAIDRLRTANIRLSVALVMAGTSPDDVLVLAQDQ